MKLGQVKITCQATVQPISYSLDEPAQVAVGMLVRSGDVTHCTDFGGPSCRTRP